MIVYRDARPGDGAALGAMAQQGFLETFAHLYRSIDIQPFLTDMYGPNGLPAQISDPAYAIHIALDGERIAGFAKLGPCALPAPASPEACELKQLYVLQPWQGAGIAATLMDWAIATARTKGAAEMVLSVFNENVRAQRFYARYGFAAIGAAPFRVGDQLDDDRIWRLIL
jgi:diamine N-acetyltransferase